MNKRIHLSKIPLRKVISILSCLSIIICSAPATFAESAREYAGAMYSAPDLQDVGELSVTHPVPEGIDFDVSAARTVTSEFMDRPDIIPIDNSPADSDFQTKELLFDESTYQPEELVALQEQAASEWLESGQASDLHAAGTGLTFSQLRQKYPAGKYWNHAHNPGNAKAQNYADGWTDIPCPASHSDMIGTELQTCNAYWPGDNMIGTQCYGYADKLGFDATGTDPETWEKRTYSGALSTLKAGDIIRIDNGMGGQHSLFVIDVEGENVIYTDCNEGGTCVIRWDQTTTKSALSNNLVYVKVCPTNAFVQDEYCHCSANASGIYTATRQLSVYSTHKLSGSIIGTIPSGATVSVSMADASLCHIY